MKKKKQKPFQFILSDLREMWSLLYETTRATVLQYLNRQNLLLVFLSAELINFFIRIICDRSFVSGPNKC